MKARDPKWWDGFSFGTEIFQSFGRLSFTFRGLKRKKTPFNEHMVAYQLYKIYGVARVYLGGHF